MNIIEKILGPKILDDELIINRDDFTPQECVRCGQLIKHKDIYYRKGEYWHKECRKMYDYEKRAKRNKK